MSLVKTSLKKLPNFRLNFNHFKENKESVIASIKAREVKDVDVDLVNRLFDQLKTESAQFKSLKGKRTKFNGNENATEKAQLMNEAKEIKEQARVIEANVVDLEAKLLEEASKIPNDLHPSSPLTEPTILHVKGEKPNFTFAPLSHVELGKKWNLFNFEDGAEVAQAGFYYSLNEAVLLEMALINWIMQKMNALNFTPVITPDVVHVSFAEACGFRPRSDASQIYRIHDNDLCLIGTSEIPLAGLFSDKLYYENKDSTELPVKLVGFSHCFRAETSHGGAQNKGIYRVHQFSKVELFVVALPSMSEKIHLELLDLQMQIFSELGLHYKVLDMPANDLGAASYRKFDIEAWMPSKNDYGEISSCSNCTDYQSRRLCIRIKNDEGDSTYLHTLNGTALAVPRIMLAILENFQQADNTIKIPDVLVPYMGGKSLIGKPKILNNE